MKRSDFFKTTLGALTAAGLSGFTSKDAPSLRPTEVWPVIDPEDEQFWKFVRWICEQAIEIAANKSFHWIAEKTGSQ
ncbi:MAG: Aminotran 5 domain-containing protein [Bacteroidetes bacterium]|nr:Aminotran 5 domain-containing protein [Bacteroidota bacterium]